MAKANSTPVRKLAAAKPRCKKDDLAIVITGPYVGYILRVVQYFPSATMEDGKVMLAAWEVIHPDGNTDHIWCMEDKRLLPIRPGDIDESAIDELSLVKGELA
ncbi:MAG: hypothetical protein ABI167_03100 [Nitrosospira sp.]